MHVNDFIALYCPNNLLQIKEHIKQQISGHKMLSRNSHMNIILFGLLQIHGGLWRMGKSLFFSLK